MDLPLVKRLSTYSFSSPAFTWQSCFCFCVFASYSKFRRRFIHDLNPQYILSLFNMTAGPSGRTCLTPILIPKVIHVRQFVKSVLCLKVKKKKGEGNTLFLHQHLFITHFSTTERRFYLHTYYWWAKHVPLSYFISGSLHTWDRNDQQREPLSSFRATLLPPSPIVHLLAQRTRPLRSASKGSPLFSHIFINLWRGRLMIQELTPPSPSKTNA